MPSFNLQKPWYLPEGPIVTIHVDDFLPIRTIPVFNTIATNLPILLANFLASMCRAVPFSARAIKKNFFFDVDIVVKNEPKCDLTWSVLLSTASTRHHSFSNNYFCIVSAYK